MRKILVLSLLVGFYLLTQLNFTTVGSTGKKNCDDFKMASKKCARLLAQHQTKLKQIEGSYTKSSIDYSVNLTAQNSSFVETYLAVVRETGTAAEDTGRSPASLCQMEEGQSLKTCIDEAKKIYQTLVPN